MCFAEHKKDLFEMLSTNLNNLIDDLKLLTLELRRRQTIMKNKFIFNIKVLPDWIDYNQHMQDAYYGLAFSYAVDHFQDCVGFDQRYRIQSGCTVYVLEDHKCYLNEVKLGSDLVIKTSLLDTDKKKFILYAQMFVQDNIVATSEMLQAHVSTRPIPKISEMPLDIYKSFNKLLEQTIKIDMPSGSPRLSLSRSFTA